MAVRALLTAFVLLLATALASALISYESMRQDWRTSHMLFAHGWVEQNPRFTISGRANDVPLVCSEGMGRIRGAALTVLRDSAINNLSGRVIERLFVARYPRRKKLIRTLSWIERVAFASAVTYINSADHLRQAAANRRMAREYGYDER